MIALDPLSWRVGSWTRLLKRVFDLDLEHCPNCGGERKIIAAILEAPVIEKILTHLDGPEPNCANNVRDAGCFVGNRTACSLTTTYFGGLAGYLTRKYSV